LTRTGLLTPGFKNYVAASAIDAVTTVLDYCQSCGRRVRRIAIRVSVCRFVRLFVCPMSYLKNHMSPLHEIWCTYYMWMWFGPPLTKMQ